MWSNISVFKAYWFSQVQARRGIFGHSRQLLSLWKQRVTPWACCLPSKSNKVTRQEIKRLSCWCRVFCSSSILMEPKKTLIIFLSIAKYWEGVQFAATWISLQEFSPANANREIVSWSYRRERGLNSAHAYMQTAAYARWPQPDPLCCSANKEETKVHEI